MWDNRKIQDIRSSEFTVQLLWVCLPVQQNARRRHAGPHPPWGVSGRPGWGQLPRPQTDGRRGKKHSCERREKHAFLISVRAPDLAVSSGAITAKNPDAIMPKSDTQALLLVESSRNLVWHTARHLLRHYLKGR